MSVTPSCTFVGGWLTSVSCVDGRYEPLTFRQLHQHRSRTRDPARAGRLRPEHHFVEQEGEF